MVAMAAVTLLSTEDLSRHFGGLRAVDGVNFSMQAGEIRALIGPNGAGKSTLVGLIAGRLAPTSGHVIFAGEAVTALPDYRRVALGIAYTFQITSIFGKLSAFDNVVLAAQSSLRRHAPFWQALDMNALRRGASDALARVGLSAQRNATASELPYGYQRLLEVAMGLALEPRLLILDEPTQGLSDAEIESFCDLIRSIAKNATVLLIEHNMDVVMQLADTVTVMTAGRILADGPPAAVRANPAVQAAYLGG
jgi:branched-chain amino acid transport system ATP-binding protein